MQIAIVLYPGFTALDFIGPYEVLRCLPDAEVRFVWHEPGPITADSGVLLVGATHSFDETPSPDIILVPGGMTTIEHARDEKVLDWVRQAHQTSTWTASVCSGSVILAAAGLLEGKRATSHWVAVPLLKPFGVTAVGDERIVHEGRHRHRVPGSRRASTWGCGWPARSAARPRPRPSSLSIEYDPQPPFDSGHMSKASAATKAAATALMSKDLVKPTQLKATTVRCCGTQRSSGRAAAASAASATAAISACIRCAERYSARRKSPSSSVVGVNLAYDDRGSGDPVLFIAGRGGAAAPGTCTRCPRSCGPAIAASRSTTAVSAPRRTPTASPPTRWSRTPPR